ncbi:hypothetical protein LXL04_008946 [Taraxacum kok-saghyz]
MPTNLVVSFLTHLKWALEFLTHHIFFHHRMVGVQPENHHHGGGGGAALFDEVECGVCSRKIEDDDEMRESRCNHFFHKHCLDVWVTCRRTTCPLCHDNLAKIDGGHGRTIIGGWEVLYFDYCNACPDGDYGSWWLR